MNIPPIVLRDGAFPLKIWMMKPYGDAVPTPRKRYFNYRGSRGRLVTEGAFARLKSRFRVLHRKCESNKNTVKIMGLSCVFLHNICIEKDDSIPRKIDLTFDEVTNKRRNSNDVRDLLDLINTGSKNYLLGKADAIRVRYALKLESWKETKNVVGNAEEF